MILSDLQRNTAEPGATPLGGPEAVLLPRTVIRGESIGNRQKSEISPQSAFLDYFNVSFPINNQDGPFSTNDEDTFCSQFFAHFYAAAGDLFGPFEDRKRGIHGWTRSFSSEFGSVIFAYGGQRDTAFLSLPGDGCALVRDWTTFAEVLRDYCHAHITRADLATDDFDGVRSVDHAAEAYLNGQFKLRGRQPDHRLDGDWLEPVGNGRTLYVGNRKNGKLYRGYEKGKQLGDKSSPWVRHEVEVHNEDRIIPWDVVWNPGKYLAGTYPYLSWVNEESTRIQTIKKSANLSADFLMHHCRRTYGPLVNALTARGLTPEQIVRSISRPSVPSKLIVPHLLGVVQDAI